MNRAGKYLRISDDREGRELGVERQSEDCDALAEREHAQVVETYIDNDLSASAKARKRRPEYDRMLADAKSGQLDLIIAYTSSRLTRRPREHEDLIDLAVEYGITYRFVRSPSFDLNTSAGRRVARILAANDAGEAEDIAERVAREVRQRAERGEYHGGPRAYGYTPDGRGVMEDEAAEVRSWCEHVLAGGSLWGIRNDLNRRGVPSVSGKPWRSPVIRKILLNPRNVGLRILDGAQHPAPHPAIMPVETWRAVKAILEHPRRGAGNPTGTARKHQGTGMYRCERCDGRPVSSSYGKGHLVYKCFGCWRSWRAEPIDCFITEVVAAFIGRPDARALLTPMARGGGVDTRALSTEAAAIRENMKALAADFVTAKDARKAALDAGLKAGEDRLAEIDAMLTPASGRADPATSILKTPDPVAAWYDLDDLSRRQAIIETLMTVTLGAPLRGRVRWAPDFIDVRWTWGGQRSVEDPLD